MKTVTTRPALPYRYNRCFRYLMASDATDTKKYGHICHQRLKVNTKRYFVFRFSKIFILTVIFLILVGHIELKILTENAGLQSHTN